MGTPTAACTDLQGPYLSRDREQHGSHSGASSQPGMSMAAGNAAAPWAEVHALPQYDDNINMMLSNNQTLSWTPSPGPAAMHQQNSNYQLDGVPEYIDDGNNYHGLPDWQAHPQRSSMLSSGADPGRPRTFPAMDSLGSVSPMMIPFASTIAPQQIYQNGPPRSEAYPYGEEIDPYGQNQNVCETVEPGSAMTTIAFGDQREDYSPSYRSTSFNDDDMSPMDDDEAHGEQKEEPYAKSLFRCLRDAPEHTMVLRDIYDWYKEHTLKGKELHEKGWQNSIRHNLSMNKAFEKIEVASHLDPNKKGFQWRLSEQALHDGRVQSTTRYRNKQPNKRGSKSHNPAPHRQASGAKGGRMARFAAESRRSERLRDAQRMRMTTSHDLRSRGIMRGGNMTVLGHSSAMHGSSSHPSNMDYTSNDDDQSGASSPYNILDNDGQMYYPTHQYEPAFPSGQLSLGPHHHKQELYSSSPDHMATITPENIHWRPIGDRIFYDSSEPNSGAATPHTPSAYSDMAGESHNYGLEYCG